MERVFVKIMYDGLIYALQDKINKYLGKLADSDALYVSVDVIKDGAGNTDGYLAIIKYYSEKEVKE